MSGAHTDTFTRDNLLPRDQWPDFLLDGFDYPERDHRRGRVHRPKALGGARLRRSAPRRSATEGGAPTRNCPTGPKLACACAGRDLWRRARQLRADPSRQPGHGRLLARRHQGRRGGGQHHADAACRRAQADRRTRPRDRTKRLRHPPDGRDGIAPPCCFPKQVVGFDGTANTTPSSTARRSTSRCVSMRCRPAATMSRCSASPSARPACRRPTAHFHRDLLIIADGHAKEVLGVTPGDVFVGFAAARLSPSGSAGPRFSCCAFCRRRRDAVENASPPTHRDHREVSRDDQFHRADRSPRDAGGLRQGRRPRRRCASRYRPARRCSSPVRGLDDEDRATDPGRSAPSRCCISSSPTGSRTWRARHHRQAGDRPARRSPTRT